MALWAAELSLLLQTSSSASTRSSSLVIHWKFSTNVSLKNCPPTNSSKKCPKVQDQIFAQFTWSSSHGDHCIGDQRFEVLNMEHLIQLEVKWGNLSGATLLSFLTLKELDRTKGGNIRFWIMFFIHRYIRSINLWRFNQNAGWPDCTQSCSVSRRPWSSSLPRGFSREPLNMGSTLAKRHGD